MTRTAPSEQAAGPSAPSPDATPPAPEPDFVVGVGVGASAGGLQALKALFASAPADHFAFLVVQHQAPDYASLLVELIARITRTDVVAAHHGERLRSGTIFVCPPDAAVTVADGAIVLAPRADEQTRRHPIDHCFRSMAATLGPRAVGIVLSGTGHDGTAGVAAIRAAGGTTLVQCEATAEHTGMPSSAIASGDADFVASPADMATRLAALSHGDEAALPGGPAGDAGSSRDLERLFALIRRQIGVDLADYKMGTLTRRIERRMHLCRAESLSEYVDIAASRPAEAQAFYDDVLITVTGFFRDAHVFERLRTGVLADMAQQRAHQERDLRLWVAGCASGEEAYSLAISLAEAARAGGEAGPQQIFATDISERAIGVARRGTYSAEALRGLPPALVARYFMRRGDDHKVCRGIRDMVIFSRHNVLRDAPFSRVDLVACRNLLIYLQPRAQQRALQVLHYALNPDGMLLLGRSETVGDVPQLFSLRDREIKLYSKRPLPASAAPPELCFATPAASEPARALAPRRRQAAALAQLADRQLLDGFAPPCVVVDDALEVRHFRGPVGPYLSPAAGPASFSLLRLARPELRPGLQRVVEQVFRAQVAVQDEASWQDGEHRHVVTMRAVLLDDPGSTEAYALVMFIATDAPYPAPADYGAGPAGPPRRRGGVLARRVTELQRDLDCARDHLQATFEEKESATEELKAANEELQSANEELQSSNEELESSKEELESANEELLTMNEELQSRMGELALAHDDLHNVLAGIDVAVIIVGLDLRIRRYSDAAARLFGLVPADVGREIGVVHATLCDLEVTREAARVVAELASFAGVAHDREGRQYAVTLAPYRTLDHSIRGALLTVASVESLMNLDAVSDGISAHAERLLGPLALPLALVDGQCRIIWASHGTRRQLGHDLQVPLDLRDGARAARIGFDADLVGLIAHALAHDVPFYDHRLIVPAIAGGRPRQLRLSASCLQPQRPGRLLLLAVHVAAADA